MKKSKFSLLLILALVLSMFLAACSGGEKETGKETPKDDEDNKTEVPSDVPQEMSMLQTSEIPTMDSSINTDAVGFSMLANVNEGLYIQDAENNLIPGVADGEPEMNEEGTEWKVKLKSGLKWANGDALTANDFVYAWQRAINPETKSEYGPYMMNGKIKGATEITEAAAAGQAADLNTLGIKAEDDQTLVIQTEIPMSPDFFKGLMAFGTFLPLNQKFVEEQGDQYALSSDNLLANGPFKLADWEGPTDTEWTMVKNDTYHNADNVALTKITFNVSKDPQAAANAFEAGETDMTDKMGSDVVAQYEGDDRLYRKMTPTVFWLKINQTKTPALANVNIRKAIAMAINKDDAASAVLANGSVAANYTVPAEFVSDADGKDFRDYNGNMNEYNVEEAKKYWKKGLEELGIDSLESGYLGGDTETSKKYDTYVIDQLQTNLEGLKVNLESVPFKIRLDKDTSQDYDLQAAGWGPDYLDPMTFSDLWVTDGGNNHMGYSNPEYDKLIADTAKETDVNKRFEMLAKAEKILLDDAAVVPLYQRADNYLINPKVEGVAFHVFGPDLTFQFAKITDAE